MRFIGLDNYARIIGDETFWTALLNTVVYTVITVPIGIALRAGRRPAAQPGDARPEALFQCWSTCRW